MCFVYTGGMTAEYNYRDQLFDAIPALRDGHGVELHYFQHADHTFSRREMRSNLVQLLLHWLATNFPRSQEAVR